MEQITEAKYNSACVYLDAFTDVCSATFENLPDVVNAVNKSYNNKGDHILTDPVNNKMRDELAKAEGTSEYQTMLNTLCNEMDSYIGEMSEFILSIVGEARIAYILNEAQTLASAYENVYDENYYVDVEDSVILEREKRILSLFEKLSPAEVEKEYLLFYNVYNSKCDYIKSLTERIWENKGSDDMLKLTTETEDELKKIFEEHHMEHLEDWDQNIVRGRKEKFLDLSSTMSHEDLEICYKEMCDIMLGKMNELNILLNNLYQICTLEEYELIQEQAQNFINAMYFPDKVLENLSEEEQTILDEIFDI